MARVAGSYKRARRRHSVRSTAARNPIHLTADAHRQRLLFDVRHASHIFSAAREAVPRLTFRVRLRLATDSPGTCNGDRRRNYGVDCIDTIS